MRKTPPVIAALIAVLFATIAQAELANVRESLEIAWESLWHQSGFPTPITKWQGPIRVKFTGTGVRSHRDFALGRLRQVAEIAGVEITEVESNDATANLEVEFAIAMSYSSRSVCITDIKRAPGGAISSAKIRADKDFARGCMLHEAMHVMGIPGHPRGNSVLSYFRHSGDELTETDRFLLKTLYSSDMKPGMLPFSALSVYAQHLTDSVSAEDARNEAQAAAQAFLLETVELMESFANATGDPPRIVFQSSTSTAQGLQRGRREMMYLLGHAYTYGTIVKEDHKKAIDFLSRAAASGHVEAESFLIRVYASDSFRPAAENPIPFFVRGRLYGKEGDYERAIADFDKANSLKPNDTRTLWYRGSAHEKKRDYDRAIADFTEVIRLKKDDVGAWRSRGYAYRMKGEYQRATADLDEAIRLKPLDAGLLRVRGMMYGEKGDYGRAMADLNEAIRLKPDDPELFHGRGHINYARGEFRLAAKDFGRAVELNTKRVYPALWQYLAQQRAGDDGTPALQRYAAEANPTNWPAPVVPLYLDGSSPGAVLVAAGHSDPKKAAEQKCEAQFYIGQYLLLKGDRTGSIELLTAAANSCPRNFFEYEMANVELRRLSIEPGKAAQALQQ